MRNKLGENVENKQTSVREKRILDFKVGLLKENLTVQQWAEDNGFDPEYCRRILRSEVMGKWGKGKEIAVAMGIEDDPDKKQKKAN